MLFRWLILCFGIIFSVSIGLGAQAKTIPILDFPELDKRLKIGGDSVLLVNFWATWCGPCVAELPVFNELSKHYSTQKLKILLVSLDMPDSLSALAHFVKKQKLLPEVVLLDAPDFNSWIDRVSPKWQGSLPATLILHKSKRELFERQVSLQEIQSKLNKIFSN